MTHLKITNVINKTEVMNFAFNKELKYVEKAYLLNQKPQTNSDLFSSFPQIIMPNQKPRKQRKRIYSKIDLYKVSLKQLPKQNSLTEIELDEIDQISQKLTNFSQKRKSTKSLSPSKAFLTSLTQLPPLQPTTKTLTTGLIPIKQQKTHH